MDFALSVESAFGISLLRRYNTWYSVSDGNWSNPNIWISNALDKINYTSPQPGDTVYINNAVTLDTTIAVNNIYISGKLTADNSSRVLTVNGDLQAVGTVDFTGSDITLIMNGVNNTMASFTSGSLSTIQYSNLFYSQTILPFSYQNLNIGGYAYVPKNMVANLLVNGNFKLEGNLATNGFAISVAGTTGTSLLIGPGETSVINSTTNILFTGAVTFSGGQGLNIVGAASVECRGGISAASSGWDWSSANVDFTTNNQSISSDDGAITVNNATITGAITVSTTSTGIQTPFIINGTLNGTVAGSTFNNDGMVQFASNTTPMTTGVINYNHSAGCTVIYSYNGNLTIPLGAYNNLTIQGTGIKSASQNLSISQNFTLSGFLDMGIYNLSVTGQTNLFGSGGLLKTGAGSILFIGALGGGGGSGGTDLSGGNPTVEFRGGVDFNNMSGNWGTGVMSFTTNNQTITGNQPNSFNGPIVISGAITVTQSATIDIFNTINGTVSGSIFINLLTVNYHNSTAPMVTGKLYCNQGVNTFTYVSLGNQDIQPPSDPVSPGYYNLTLNGGIKKLLGNVSVKGTYTLTAGATLNSNGFSLTNP